jgi:hypothetical protein
LPALAVVAVAVACREPTQITVHVTTDLPCILASGARVAINGVDVVVGTVSELDTKAPTSSTSHCEADGTIGTVVIVPSSASNDPVAFAVVAGTTQTDASRTTTADDCQATGNRACIVAKRALHFIPHTPLELDVKLSASCIGKSCAEFGASYTCVDGQCVDGTIVDPGPCVDPHGPGCDPSA